MNMHKLETVQPDKIELLYDAQCPVCKAFCQNLKLQSDQPLALIDAREDSALLRKVTEMGLDIDEGMVVRVGEQIHYGSEAMYQAGELAVKQGWRAWLHKIFFNSRKKADVFYAVGKSIRNLLLRLLHIEDIHNLKPENTLKSQLGDEWVKLNPNIQHRFAKEPLVGEEIIYQGKMTEIRRSKMGWLFAKITSIIGNPLTPFVGKNVPMSVKLLKKPNKKGVFWQRTYFMPDRKPYTVTSIKRESKNKEMLECVGGGFGMKLKVYVQNASLHFKSYRYFCSLFKWKLPLPHWLTPGQTHVEHKDLGGGFFQFTIAIQHKILGETFFQQGVFHQQQENNHAY